MDINPERSKKQYIRNPYQRKRTGLIYYLIELIICSGSLPKEHLRSILRYPPCYDRVLKRATGAGYFTIYKTSQGLEVIKLNMSGYYYVLRFKKKRPEVFERLFGERLRQFNKVIDENHRFSWGVANFDAYKNYDAPKSWYKSKK